MITQKYILGGGLKSSDDAANAKLKAMDEYAKSTMEQGAETSRTQMDNDAKLAQLIKGDALKQEAIARHQKAADDAARAGGMKPGKYSQNVSEGGYAVNPENDPFASQLAKGIRAANITGFDITDPSVLPSSKDAEEVKQAAAAVKQGQQYIPEVAKAVQGSNAMDRFGSMNIGPLRIGTEKGRDLEQRKSALLDYARSLSNTGVLQPGEIPMLEKRIGDMTGIGSMMRSPEDIKRQLAEFQEQLRQRADTHSRARGYTPRSGYLDSTVPRAPAAPATGKVPTFEEWKAMKNGR